MNRIPNIILLCCAITAFAYAESFINDFLYLNTDIRTSAMGGCRMASGGAAAVFGNPARIAEDNEWVFVSHEQLYQGLVISDAAGIVLDIGGPGTFAIGALYVGGGDIKVTALPDQSQPISAKNRPYEVASKSHHDIALVPGYAINVGENWLLGASWAIMYRHLVDNSAFGGSMSFGATWRPISSLTAGAAMRNISCISWNTDDKTVEFGAPSLGLGAHYTVTLGSGFAAVACLEGQYLPQEALFECFAGGEASYENLAAIRCGINNNGFTAGADVLLVGGVRAGAALILHNDLPVSYRVGMILERQNEAG